MRNVCAYWRDIIDGNPILWTEITYNGFQPTDILSRTVTASYPLHIKINLIFQNRPIHRPPLPLTHDENPDISGINCNKILDITLLALHRITDLEISSSCSVEVAVISSHFDVLVTGKSLRSLGIHQMKECNGGISSRIPALNLANRNPSLVDLRLTCLPFTLATSPLILASITSLDLHLDHQTSTISGRWRLLNHLLSFAPKLETLRITLSKNPKCSLPFQGVNLPKLTHLAITITESQYASLILPSFYSGTITSLSVSYRNNFMSDDDSSQTFYRLMFPVSLGLHAPTLRNLTTFIMSWHTVNDSTITIIAHQLILLENLVIHNVGAPILGPNKLISYLLHSGIMWEFARRQQLGLTVPCCPRLKRVETYGTEKRCDVYFVHSRRRIGLPLTLRGHYI